MPRTEGAGRRVKKPDPSPAPVQPRLERLAEWLDARQTLIVFLLIALSALVRIGYYREAQGSPLLSAHLWSEADMGFFDHWAKVILHEDPLGRSQLHPFFAWQTAPAEAHFHAHPEQVAHYENTGVPKGDTAALYRALWDHWSHGNEFYQEPLYVYLVAATYAVTGASIRAVFCWQMLMGIGTNLLVYWLARRYFGPVTAAIAGLFIALYSPLFLYDLTLLRTTLTAFLAAIAVVALEISLAGGSWKRWLAAGAAIGLAMDCQSTFVFFLAGALFLLWTKFRPSMAPVLRLAAVTLCGAGLAISPIVIRNAMVGAPPFGWAGAGVWTFVRFNTPSADPWLGVLAPTMPDHLRILAASDAKALPAVAATLHEHTAGSLAHLLFAKFEKIWHWFEEPDNIDLYYAQIYSVALRYAPITNAVIAPLLLVGLGLFIRQWKRYGPLYLLAANAMAVMLITYPTGRYRAPYFAVLIPLAAAVIMQALTWAEAREWKKAAILCGALAIAILWTWQPIPPTRQLIRAASLRAPYQYYWKPQRDAAIQRNDWNAAERLDRQLLRGEPEDLAMRHDPRLVVFFAHAHAALSDDLQHLGDAGGASLELTRANQMMASPVR